MHRPTHLHRARTERFDVCVIGGGATGTGVALDAALRGLNVCVLEADDFAARTSSKSTKLIHGGVRYLEQAFKHLDWEQFRMVRKGLTERKFLLQNAPHLTRPLALLTPCHAWTERFYYGTGLKMYDALAGRDNLADSHQLSTDEALAFIPTLRKETLRGAVLYSDGQLDDARFALALAKTASASGAAVLNHVRAVRFGKTVDGSLQTLNVRDELTGDFFEINSRLFVNATGTAADHLRLMANPALAPRMRASKGAHLILPKTLLGGDTALLVPKTDDGRVIFVIPWQDHVLVGTTDTEAEPTDEPLLLQNEVTYLLDYVRRYLDVAVSPADVRAGFAGLRPLLQADPNAPSKTLVRDHEVEVDAASGLVSILGGKWTTYRLMAQDTVDECLRQLGEAPRPCRTETCRLAGGDGFTPDGWQALNLPAEAARHLWKKYGTEAVEVVELARQHPALAEPLAGGHPFLAAEVVHVARHEMALTLTDVLARRLGLEALDWAAAEHALPTVAALLAAELGWSKAQAQAQTDAYRQHLDHQREAAFAHQKSTA
jgi:glycerol-3-phosphate dehydrogenase